ncbi:MAG TPA: hypothetical protein VGM84_07080 [Steroidobacteraceae bacterium]
MQIEAIAVRLRARSNMEAADMGIRLCQASARSVYNSYFAVALPLVALTLASFEFAEWLPSTLLWLAKPWLDRSILFALSRAAFGQPTKPIDVWEAQRDVWWRQMLLTLLWRRLSPWRSFTQPVYQLEGLRGEARRKRVAQIRRGHAGSGALIATIFGLVELILMGSLVSLAYMLAPSGYEPDLSQLFLGTAKPITSFSLQAAYAVVVLFLEPFFVAAGFGLYLNRRAELEAWDIEQEFRRAFAV